MADRTQILPVDPGGFTESDFRRVLGHFASGVVVATTMNHEAPAGLTIQSFCSLSLNPPLVVLCPSLASSSWPQIRGSGHACVNVLAEGQKDLALRFSRPGGNKFAGVRWRPSPLTSSPMLAGAAAWLDCALDAEHVYGDHLVAVFRVLDLSARGQAKPLVFYRSEFRNL